MCQVGAAGGGMPPVQQAPVKVGGVDGGAMPAAKVDQQPSTVAGDAGAGAKLIGGGPGDLGSVLASLVDALKSVVAALSGGATGGGPAKAIAPDPIQEARSHGGLMHAVTVSGRPVTLVKDARGPADVFSLQVPTGQPETVNVDDRSMRFDATGRHVGG